MTQMEYQAGEARIRKRRTQEAISLAVQGRWEEAVDTNRSIIEIFPNDINAYNRLGKALTEIGRYQEAKEAYNQALKIDSKNSIARKNLRRLSLLKGVETGPNAGRQKLSPHLFIEETGKAGLATLENMAPREVLAKMLPGDPVILELKGQGLIVNSEEGEYLGQVEPKIGARLSKLIEGGNRYVAAVASANDGKIKIIITEIYQHSSQVGRPSFPPRGDDGFRSYVKKSILRYELGEEERSVDDSGEPVELEEEAEALPDGITIVAPEEEGAGFNDEEI